MAITKIQKEIMGELKSHEELSLDDLVKRVRPDSRSGRDEVKAAVVPMLYQRQLTLTPNRKLRLGS